MKRATPEDRFAVTSGVMALVMGATGILWTAFAIGMGAQDIIVLLGVLFVVVAIVQGLLSFFSVSKRRRAAPFAPPAQKDAPDPSCGGTAGSAQTPAPSCGRCPDCGALAAKGLRTCVKCGRALT